MQTLFNAARPAVVGVVLLGCTLMRPSIQPCNADPPAAKPNFLLILADDCTYSDLPVYGGRNAKTPHIDRLAAEGLQFQRAFLSEAMCQPCRSELYTGLYPLGNGCAWNHSASRPGVHSLPHYLRPLGYRVGLAGKVHVTPQTVYPFDPVKGFDPNCVDNPTRPHDVEFIEEYMADHGQPFCLIVALTEPHVPWVMGDPSKYPPKKLELPAYLAATPEMRKAFSRYLAEITYMDSQVGDILAALGRAGAEKNTLVLFTSEQGAQHPGCKWTNWNTGVHTALIARWPGVVAKGTRTEALVQYADVAPTLIELAGGANTRLDGSSFAAVLRGQSDSHRKYVYTVHNNIPEGPPYPIRSITDGRVHYLRNLRPDELYLERHLMGAGPLNNPEWASWMGAPWAYPLVKRYMRRPAEELYRLTDDPYEMTNLAGNAEFAQIQAELSAALDAWMRGQHDPGAVVDTAEALQAARQGRHLHGPPLRTNP